MAASNSSSSSSNSPSARSLAEAPRRASTFLLALAAITRLRKAMNAHGYSQAEQQEGWRLLVKVGCRESGVSSSAAMDAMRELDAWDELAFHRAHAALARSYPAQGDFVFEGLEATQGPGAVFGVAIFLERLDALEKGDGRAATRAQDQAAVALLATRGFDAAERARLRALVEIVQKDDAMPGDAEGQSEEDLKALYGWVTEWTEVARAIVTRRADRIALGIARRRKADGKEEFDDAPEDVAPVSAPTQVPVPVPVPVGGAAASGPDTAKAPVVIAPPPA